MVADTSVCRFGIEVVEGGVAVGETERGGGWRALVGCARVAVVTGVDVLVIALQEDVLVEEEQRFSPLEDRVMEERGRGCLTSLCLSMDPEGTVITFSSFVILSGIMTP